MNQFYIRSLTEQDLTSVVEAAGGTIAHPDATRRKKRGADFDLQGSIIELKFLTENGFLKERRQQRLSTLFRNEGFQAPVVVLDRKNLSSVGQQAYDRIVEGPIKTVVATARRQLRQTRKERPNANLSILWIVNNGYIPLTHDDLVRLVEHRVRNDSRSIDGIIVGGCYFHSDGFDSVFLWPLSYIPIRSVEYPGFPRLHNEWNQFADRFMTTAARGQLRIDQKKGPVIDTQFEVEGITFVNPAPPFGGKSEFYPRGRPRLNTSDTYTSQPVALTSPKLSHAEWKKMRSALPDIRELCDSYEDWLKQERKGHEDGTALRPFVSVQITFHGWRLWCDENKRESTITSIRDYANTIFLDRLRRTISTARELKDDRIVPARYILAVTEEIGQDKANDLSRIAIVTHRLTGESEICSIVKDLRITREHAVTLASSYAVAEGVGLVMWSVCRKYAWW